VAQQNINKKLKP